MGSCSCGMKLEPTGYCVRCEPNHDPFEHEVGMTDEEKQQAITAILKRITEENRHMPINAGFVPALMRDAAQECTDEIGETVIVVIVADEFVGYVLP